VLGGWSSPSVCEYICATAAERRRTEGNVGSGLETRWATFCDLSSSGRVGGGIVLRGGTVDVCIRVLNRWPED
jgi:hypothetical protein